MEDHTATLALFATALAIAFILIGRLHRLPSGGPRIRLVSAGPGNPELLTLGASKALAEAELVVADRLIPRSILAMIRRGAEVRIARKIKGRADMAQAELQRWVLEGLMRGLNVVRLKGGDSFVYGRSTEEIEAYSAAGFDVEVLPGVTSALAAPMAAGIAVTSRGVADQFVLATGHGRSGSVPDLPAYRAGRTTVFLMSVGRLSALSERLVRELGYPSQLPVAIVENAIY